jgi:UDP-GlcNAc3NAcA epimerase
MTTIATIVGARPQFIKAAALSRLLKTHASIKEILIHTGQHYDIKMSEIFFKELELPKPHYNLEVGSHDHGKQTGLMLEKIEALLDHIHPAAVLVYGDTNSTLAGALAAAKKHLPVYHVEAGLRSYEKNMPEELNRVLTDHVSTLLFCPTSTAITNLIKEGIFHQDSSKHDINHPGVYLTGDIMYDVALFYREKAQKVSRILEKRMLNETSFFLLTIHRSENTDSREKLEQLIQLLEMVLERYPQHVIFFPMHPRTKKMFSEFQLLDRLAKLTRLIISEPVSYLDMILLESSADLIMTDSGGVQKEAYFFEKPCFILRNETEWVEILTQKKGALWNYDNASALEKIDQLFHNYDSTFEPVFGNGQAAQNILKIIEEELSFDV